ncbi:hypothetical protein [Nocardia sp. NRRL S-836]|uniref:hypothetical protein n=1 Tax=Nocardia sp. NRRL S-836 TaxID=1519492 RepID=UPI0006AE08E0|nr:hypothetical protein [Nocardia sp. NRRL S-836]KOV84775.1 hypothetical protein ADL03_16045 [Nocardia sp. NRRL S-836]
MTRSDSPTAAIDHTHRDGDDSGSPQGTIVDRDLDIWIHTEQLWRELESAAGLPKYELGRFKEWCALQRATFSANSYDLDAMISWARSRGIPHTVTSSVHYTGTTGKVDFRDDTLTLTT